MANKKKAYHLSHRCALVVKLKKPFFDWADIEMNQLSEDMMEPDVYLIPDFEEHKDVKGWIRRNYDAVFRNILFGVYTNEAMWPKNRTYDLFCKWVDFSSHLMVWELE
ncbi:MAG: hypothetical protein KBG76_18225 [Saprospiraceae bacterium]|nr:hypothetical protein [Saprospiraceae bacterium]